jgi:hypothetical protein
LSKHLDALEHVIEEVIERLAGLPLLGPVA